MQWQAAAEASKCDGLSGEKTDSSSDTSKLSSKSAKERRNRRKKRQRQGEDERDEDSNREGNDRKASVRFTADGKIKSSRERISTSPHQVRKNLILSFDVYFTSKKFVICLNIEDNSHISACEIRIIMEMSYCLCVIIIILLYVILLQF